MADALQLFDARRSKWCNPATGELTREAQAFLRELWLRAGGAAGPTTNELALSQFEDAGVEETKALLFSARDAAGQDPAALPMQFPEMDLSPRHEPTALDHIEAQLHSIAAQLAELRKDVDGINQRNEQ